MTAIRSLAFRELNIIRMPGLPGSIRLEDLGPGVVIVAGPNASGKTTSARVMNYLLWPEVADKELAQFGFALHHLSLRGRLAIGGEEWTTGYESGSRLLRRGSSSEKELPVPPHEHQQRYNLALSQLLAGEDRDFAAWIHREAMGGFDPDRAGAELIQRVGLPRKSLAEYKAWDQASGEVRRITKEDEQLRRDQLRLEDLTSRRNQAGSRARKIRMFEWVMELRDTESRLEEEVALIGSYPEAQAQYHVQIRASIEEAGESIRRLETELEDLEGGLAGFRQEQEAIGLPDGGVAQERMERMTGLLRDIEDDDTQIVRVDRDIATADAERKSILKQIGSGEAGSEVKTDADTTSLESATFDSANIEVEGFQPGWVKRAADLVKREAEAENHRLAAESELALLQESDEDEVDVAEVSPSAATGQTATVPEEETGNRTADAMRPAGRGAADKAASKKEPKGTGAANESSKVKSNATAEDVRKGIDLLTDWIREVAGARLRGIPPLRVFAMLLLAAAAVAGMLLDPWAGLLVLVPAGWLAVEWLLLRRARIEAEEGRIPQKFSRIGLDGFIKWETEAVKDRLLVLVDDYLPLRESERRRERRKVLEKKKDDALAALREIGAARDELAAKSGVAPEGVGLPGLHALLQQIFRYNETQSRLAGLREEREKLNGSRSRLEGEFRELIGAYDAEDGAVSSRDLREQLDRLLQRNNLWRELREKIRNAEEQLERAQGRRKQEQERVARLYGTVGLESGDYTGLLKLDEQHDEYQEHVRQKHVLEQQRETRLADIGRHEAFEPDVAELKREQAEAEVAACRRAEETERKLQNEITEIETRLNMRTGKHDLGDALRQEDMARENLANQFESWLSDAMLGRTVEWLKKENQRRNYPEVFHRANELFRKFTEYRYELEVQDGGLAGGDGLAGHGAGRGVRDTGRVQGGRSSGHGGPGFVALDHGNNGDPYPLDRLSEGTRIQLLLAVRMAFVEQLEGGVRLPFFADELLAVSDDARAGAIMDALLAISREGRQVFYFTAQGDEVEKWLQKAAATGDGELVQVRTLGRGELFRSGGEGLSGEDAGSAIDARGLEDSEHGRNAKGDGTDQTQSRWRFGYGADVPLPKGTSHKKYGAALDVPTLDPLSDEADRLHPWYLTEDTELIYQCLRNGLLTWRQVRLFLENEGMLVAGEEQIGKMKEAARLAARALELWREGRPRPITPSVLRDSGAITGAYLERADALARRVGYDPIRFMKEIDEGALPRFRDDRKAELRTWLDDNGFLPEAGPLSDEEMQVRLRAQASGFRYLEQEEAERVVERIIRSSAGSQENETMPRS
jgi:energy-coupling factor transporter ATP-binding protein EcfA2